MGCLLLKYRVVNELQNLGVAGERLEEEREFSETIFFFPFCSLPVTRKSERRGSSSCRLSCVCFRNSNTKNFGPYGYVWLINLRNNVYGLDYLFRNILDLTPQKALTISFNYSQMP